MIEIIAEIGVNHNGDFNTACNLVDAAIDAGCNAIKTQLWNSARVYEGGKIAEMMRLELSRKQIRDLHSYCIDNGIELIVTPDEIDDAIFLKEVGVKRIKTSSQDVTNLKFLRSVAELGVPIILSTGASTWDELTDAIRAAKNHPDHLIWEGLTVLHCVSAYPAPLSQMNLKVIAHLDRMDYVSRVGLSDHTVGTEAAIMAIALGATIFEKHLTLDKNQEGPDHKASATPDEMWLYVQTLRACEVAMGDGDKRVMPCERENRSRFDAFVRKRASL